jgi:hypothetical protein
MSASGITEGWLFRAINKAGEIWGTGMTPKVLWEIVRPAAKVPGYREACSSRAAKNVRSPLSSGCELDQLQFQLGHVSIQTMEHCL